MPRVPQSISRREQYRIYLNIILTTVRRWLNRKSPSRTMEGTRREYDKKWKKWSEGNYLLEGNTETRISLLRGLPVVARQIDYRKHVIEKFADAINSLQPESVLEIGSGNGLNVLCLALLCPTVKRWAGIELAETGVEAARNYLKELPLESIAYVTKVSKEMIAQRIANAQITFKKGDMHILPMRDNEFDFVYSFHVLEQAPDTYKKALSEAHRVTKKHAAFFEFWNEGQNIFQRIHIRNRGFFQGSFRDVEPIGFGILRFEVSELTQVAFAGCFLLCAANKDSQRNDHVRRG